MMDAVFLIRVGVVEVQERKGVNKMKDKIIVWDDCGLLFGPRDSFKKILQDAETLLNAYEKRERPMFTGVEQVMSDIIARRVFLIGFISLTKRLERLDPYEKEKISSYIKGV